MSKFEIGKVVILKSGGECMTVEGYDKSMSPPMWSTAYGKTKGKFNDLLFLRQLFKSMNH
jgi:uncharacterized protein YodC (DUF2158 family)